MFRKYPYTFTTKKPLEVRMGKGKGSHDQWVCPIKIGQIILEFNFLKINQIEAFKILKKCSNRLPVKNMIIKKNGI